MGKISNLLAMALAVALTMCLFVAPAAAEDVAPAPDAIVSMDTLGDEAAAVADIDVPTNDLAGLDTDRALTDSGTAIAALSSEPATDGRNTAALGDSPAPPATANGEPSPAAISWREPRPA